MSFQSGSERHSHSEKQLPFPPHDHYIPNSAIDVAIAPSHLHNEATDIASVMQAFEPVFPLYDINKPMEHRNVKDPAEVKVVEELRRMYTDLENRNGKGTVRDSTLLSKEVMRALIARKKYLIDQFGEKDALNGLLGEAADTIGYLSALFITTSHQLQVSHSLLASTETQRSHQFKETQSAQNRLIQTLDENVDLHSQIGKLREELDKLGGLESFEAQLSRRQRGRLAVDDQKKFDRTRAGFLATLKRAENTRERIAREIFGEEHDASLGVPDPVAPSLEGRFRSGGVKPLQLAGRGSSSVSS